MVEFATELERRVYAIGLVLNDGIHKAEAARRVGRSREWIYKWLGRFAEEGPAGLSDRSRAPLGRPAATSDVTVAAVLEVRDELERSPVASVGGLSILAAMERRGHVRLPSVATIERILSRASATRPAVKRRRSGKRLPLPHVTLPGIWQQADWIQDRYLAGGIRFNSLQVADVGSHGITSGQFLDRRLLTAVTFLVETAWPQLSIPQAISTDNAFVHTTHRLNPFTTWVKACLFFGVEVIIGPPGSHGWTNHIEYVNNLWQDRTIRARHFESLDQLRAGSDKACWWFNNQRPMLDPDSCGTRYSARYIDQHRDTLRWPPDIAVGDHLDRTGALQIPLTAGRVTFIRYLTEQRTITLAGATWQVPPAVPKGGLVTATIETAQQQLTISHRGQPAIVYPYRINQPIADPYHPPADRSLLHHV